MNNKRILAAALFCGFISALAPAATGLPFVSSFERGTGEWNGNVHGGIEIIDGAARARLRANTYNDNYIEQLFGNHVTQRGDKVEEAWLSLSSRFGAGYQFPARYEHKLAILNLTDGRSWQRRYQVFISVDPRGRYQVTHSDIGAWRFNSLTQNQGEAVTVRYDQWDRLKMHVRLNTPGRRDGVVQLWVNGQLKLDHRGLDLRGDTDYGMTTLILSSYTPQNGGDGWQWWDDWRLAETDDGPPAPSIPRPPVLRRAD